MIGRRGDHGAQAFDDALRGRGALDLDAELAQLVRTTQLISEAALAEPAPEFSRSLRDQLLAEAATLPAPVAAATSSSRATSALDADVERPRQTRRRFAGLTAALVAGAATVGMVSSSATAVPGDLLYPVKQGTESVQLALHRSDTARGEFQLDQARERLAEAWYLDSNGRDDRVAEALDNFSDQASSGSTRLFEAAQGTVTQEQSTRAITAVNDFAADSTKTLTKMSKNLPPEARTALDDAASTVTALVSQASTLCASCSTADLSSLTEAVQNAAAATPIEPLPQSEQKKAADAKPSAAAPTPTSRAAAPSAAAPTRAPSTKAPKLKDVTDPVVGGLLGGDKQEGLIPSVLGLLTP